MRFERVYPVEIWIKGKMQSKAGLEEYLQKDKPDMVITGIDEVERFQKEGISVYKVKGFSTNPQPR